LCGSKQGFEIEGSPALLHNVESVGIDLLAFATTASCVNDGELDAKAELQVSKAATEECC
jgi:hypothetical protein